MQIGNHIYVPLSKRDETEKKCIKKTSMTFNASVKLAFCRPSIMQNRTSTRKLLNMLRLQYRSFAQPQQRDHLSPIYLGVYIFLISYSVLTTYK